MTFTKVGKINNKKKDKTPETITMEAGIRAIIDSINLSFLFFILIGFWFLLTKHAIC